jgi:hypothetical protein
MSTDLEDRMNVTGVEWRDLDPHGGQDGSKRPPHRAPKPPDPGDDVVEIHGSGEEESADGLDQIEPPVELDRGSR